MEKKYYIAYGSNLNIDQMHFRCPGARVIGTSVIEDYEVLFKGSKTGAYLTIEPRAGAKVPVAVWETTAGDEIALDRYEGCPVFYYKTKMVLPVKNIRTGKITNRKAYVYIMHEERNLGIPTLRYIETCLEGYRAFEFDESLLYEAIDKSRRCGRED